MTNEIWLPAPGHPGYEISSLGRVKSLARGVSFSRLGLPSGRFVPEKILKQTRSKTGYMSVRLAAEGTVTFVLVHRLVAAAFIPGSPSGDQVNHKNGNKADNSLKNLEWASASSNQMHRARVLKVAVGEAHYRSIISNADVVKIRMLHSLGSGLNELAGCYGVSRSQIWRIVTGKSRISI